VARRIVAMKENGEGKGNERKRGEKESVEIEKFHRVSNVSNNK